MAVGDDAGAGLGEGYGDGHIFSLGSPLVETRSNLKSLHTSAELATLRSLSTIDDWSQSINFDPPSSESQANFPATTWPEPDEEENPNRGQSEQSLGRDMSEVSSVKTQSVLSFGDVAREPVRSGFTKSEGMNCSDTSLALSEPQRVIAPQRHHYPKLQVSPLNPWPHDASWHSRDFLKYTEFRGDPVEHFLAILDRVAFCCQTSEMEMFLADKIHQVHLLLTAIGRSPIRADPVDRLWQEWSPWQAEILNLLHEEPEFIKLFDTKWYVPDASRSDPLQLAHRRGPGYSRSLRRRFERLHSYYLSVLSEGRLDVTCTILVISERVFRGLEANDDVPDFRGTLIEISDSPRLPFLLPILFVLAYRKKFSLEHKPQRIEIETMATVQHVSDCSRAYQSLWWAIHSASVPECLRSFINLKSNLLDLLDEAAQGLCTLSWFALKEHQDTQTISDIPSLTSMWSWLFS